MIMLYCPDRWICIASPAPTLSILRIHSSTLPPRPEQRVYFLNPWACSEFKPTGSSKMGVNVLQVKMCGHIKITKKKHIAGAKTRDYFHHVISLQIILEKSWFA